MYHILCYIILSHYFLFSFCFNFLTNLWPRKFEIRDIHWMLENKTRSRFYYFISQKQARFDTLFATNLCFERDKLAPKNPRSRFSCNSCSALGAWPKSATGCIFFRGFLVIYIKGGHYKTSLNVQHEKFSPKV